MKFFFMMATVVRLSERMRMTMGPFCPQENDIEVTADADAVIVFFIFFAVLLSCLMSIKYCLFV